MLAMTMLGSDSRFTMTSRAMRFAMSSSQPDTPSKVSPSLMRVGGAGMYSSVIVHAPDGRR